MKNIFIIMLFSLVVSSANAQDYFKRLQEAFDTRGANPIADGMHRNVYISYFEDGASRCISGKVRVENNKIVRVFLQYDDNTYVLMDAKFYNSEKQQPTIVNGISEMIYTVDGEKFKVVFIDVLKPE